VITVMICLRCASAFFPVFLPESADETLVASQTQLELGENRLTKDIVLAAIPAFPPVVLRVLDLLSGPETEVAPLVDQIASDPTLAAQLLRLANSPIFGLPSQIETVQHGITTLGFERVRCLVTAVATSNYMRAALRTEALERCWRHTLATAILSRELARAAGMATDRAYSLGLLHDIGRLGLLVAFPKEYAGILKAVDRDAISLLDQEKKRFGLDHCETGRLLLEQWNLPSDFCLVVGRHHDPPSGEPLDSLKICYLACQLADSLGYAIAPPLKPLPFQEIRAMLPPSAQGGFPEEPETLTALIDRTVGIQAAAADPPALDEEPAPPAAPVAAAETNPSAMGRSLFGQIQGSPTAWDLLVVLLTGAIFTGMLAGTLWFWER
jgi:HD-like signal output (HDOD) protein